MIGQGSQTDAGRPTVTEQETKMTESSTRAFAPTEPYTVTDVAGHLPVGLDDFVGATTVSVVGDDQQFRMRGAGRREGPAVRFHEKELASAADETPVWRIIEQSDGHIVAEPPAI
jgi:hypothetical protein